MRFKFIQIILQWINQDISLQYLARIIFIYEKTIID